MKLSLFFFTFVLLSGCVPLGQVTSYTSCEDIAISCMDTCNTIKDSINMMSCFNTCDEKTTLCYCHTGKIDDKSSCCWVGAFEKGVCCPEPGIKTGCDNI